MSMQGRKREIQKLSNDGKIEPEGDEKKTRFKFIIN